MTTDAQSYSIRLNGRVIGHVNRPAGTVDDWSATLTPTGHPADVRTVGHFSTAPRAMFSLMAAYEAHVTNAALLFDPAVTLTDENGELPD